MHARFSPSGEVGSAEDVREIAKKGGFHHGEPAPVKTAGDITWTGAVFSIQRSVYVLKLYFPDLASGFLCLPAKLV